MDKADSGVQGSLALRVVDGLVDCMFVMFSDTISPSGIFGIFSCAVAFGPKSGHPNECNTNFPGVAHHASLLSCLACC